MRISLVALHFAEYAGRLALALAEKHQVQLILRVENARDELPDELLALLESNVSLRFVSLRRRRDPRILGTSLVVNRLLDEFGPDVIHMQELHPMLLGWTQLSHVRRIPVILTVHDPVQHSGGLSKKSLQWRITTWFRRHASRVIVHGPRMRAELEDLDPRITGHVDVIPHGVLGCTRVDEDISGYEPGTFLFFGRIQSYKGLRYFLDAGDILHGRGHAIRLVVAGTGNDLVNHRQRIESTGWVELIDRYIAASEIPALFRRAMGVVLPYTDATQSGVSAMAFASSRPVIATRVGDLPDVVIDGRNGLIVPPRDGQSLAAAMEKLLTEHGLRDSLATNATQFAKHNLSWTTISDATISSYRRALEALENHGRALEKRGRGA